MEGQKKQIVKVVFVGISASGKSCIVNGYTQSYKPTIGVDFSSHEFTIDGEIVKFNIWDISTQMALNDQGYDYCKNGQIVVCVYAADDKQSFINCKELAERLLKEDKLKYNAKAALVATKIDLQRQVSHQQGYTAAEGFRSNPNTSVETYFEVSAKNQKGCLGRLCLGFFRILKDETIRTLVQISQQSAHPAPPMNISSHFKLGAQPEKNPQYDKLLKILVKGEEKGGKTTLIRRFTHNQTIQEYIPTIGVDFATKNIQVSGEKVKLQIWDTAGMHKFRLNTNYYIKACQGFIFLYDCTNVESFKSIVQHVDEVEKYCPDNLKIAKFLVANKIDLKDLRLITRQMGEQIAKKFGYEYLQASALENTHVEELFYNLSDRLIKNGIV